MLVSIGPSAYVEPPDLIHSEPYHMEFFVQSEQLHEFDVFTSAASRPFVAPVGSSMASYPMVLEGARLSLSSDWELGITAAPLLSFGGLSYIARLAAKYRLFGATSEHREFTGWNGAAYFHYVDSRMSSSGDQAYLFGPGGYGWSTNSDFNGPSVGMSVGYRFTPNLEAYIGATDEEFNVYGSVHQDATGDGKYPVMNYSFPTQAGSSKTISAGLLYGVRSELGIIVSHTDVSWGSLTNSMTTMNLSLAFDPFEKQLPQIEPLESKANF